MDVDDDEVVLYPEDVDDVRNVDSVVVPVDIGETWFDASLGKAKGRTNM